MCGIAGFLYKNRQREFDAKSITQMVSVQKHRGPDDEGVCAFYDDKIEDVNMEQPLSVNGAKGFFGFSRLSILDLTQAGHQPMMNKHNTVALVFNGEIYNANDYRESLMAKGYVFRSNTDTEVILAMYTEFGLEKMLQKLNGMFAIAIYDLVKKSLYIARDRFGIKPVYIYNDKNIMIFASEIKSILSSGKITPKLDKQGYQETFVFGNSLRHTLIENISPIQPGEYYVIDGNGSIKVNRYFSIEDFKRSSSKKFTSNESINALDKALHDSVERQLISDVKVGCQLSGGVDSSLICSYARSIKGSIFDDSIAVIFDEEHQELSEEKYIDYVCKKLGMKSHKATLDAEFYIRNLELINWYLDTIPAYHNELGIYALAQEAKKHVTVLLSGEGADELLGGYGRMAYANLIEVMSRFKMLIPQRLKNIIWKERKYISFDEYVIFREAIPLSICDKVIDKFSDNIVSSDRKKCLEGFSGAALERQIKYEMSVRIQGLLNRQDKSTMANSIENRVPFLDNEMVEFAFKIPAGHLLKIRVKDILKKGGTRVQGKYILKKICERKFGENFAFRDKCGFEIPYRKFLSGERFQDYFKSIIMPGMERRNLVNTEIIRQWNEHIKNISSDELNAFWRCVNLEICAQLFIDGRKAQEIC